MAKKISQLPQTSSWNDDDLLELAVVDGVSPTGYASRAIRAGDLIQSSPGGSIPFRHKVEFSVPLEQSDDTFILEFDTNQIPSNEALHLDNISDEWTPYVMSMDINLVALGAVDSESTGTIPIVSRTTVLATWAEDTENHRKYVYTFASAGLFGGNIGGSITNDLYYTAQINPIEITRSNNILYIKYEYIPDYNNLYPVPYRVSVCGYIDVTTILAPG